MKNCQEKKNWKIGKKKKKKNWKIGKKKKVEKLAKKKRP